MTSTAGYFECFANQASALVNSMFSSGNAAAPPMLSVKSAAAALKAEILVPNRKNKPPTVPIPRVLAIFAAFLRGGNHDLIDRIINRLAKWYTTPGTALSMHSILELDAVFSKHGIKRIAFVNAGTGYWELWIATVLNVVLVHEGTQPFEFVITDAHCEADETRPLQGVLPMTACEAAAKYGRDDTAIVSIQPAATHHPDWVKIRRQFKLFVVYGKVPQVDPRTPIATIVPPQVDADLRAFMVFGPTTP